MALDRQAEGDLTLFISGMLIINEGDEHGIIEDCGRLSKIDTVFIEILGGLVGVPFELTVCGQGRVLPRRLACC
jgi:hypothetical protein